MTTMETAQKLVELCKAGKNMDAINTLYAEDVVSVEAGGPNGNVDRESKGVEAVRGKNKWWNDNHEVHSASVTGPWPHDDRFIAGYTYDITQKASGNRFTMEEMALYTVKDGKIAREEFFYSM